MTGRTARGADRSKGGRGGLGGRRSGPRLLAAGLVVAALAGCSSSGGTAAGTAGKGFVSGDGTITVLPAAQRPAPVALAGQTLEGDRLDLSTLRGKVVVLNVWGSWCGPCRKEAPDLEKAYRALQPQGVEFVGLNVNEQSPSQAIAFQKKFGITYPSLADDGGKSLLALRGAVSAKAIPSTLVLDKEGRIAVRISDATTATTLTDLVEDVAAGRDPQVTGS